MDSQELQKLKNRYDIIGNDAELNRALETAVGIAPVDIIVLISGESGVGKENIPKIIHENSRRKNAKYFAVNCGAIPEGTIDSELFGHEKGSFTGAIETRKGYFEVANGGTLFLDEIGELPLATQAKLLRVLQNGEYIKVGSSKVEKTDVRVIAATNVNLLDAVAKGKFRADLYFRLNGVQINMPALRERKADIHLLFRKFTSDFSAKYNTSKITLTRAAVERLINYRWPGNIRQLKNFAEMISALETKPISSASETVYIDEEILEKYMPKEPDETHLVVVDGAQPSSGSMSDAEKQAIVKAILDLKQEVDDLKKYIHSTQNQGPVKTLPPMTDVDEQLDEHPGITKKDDMLIDEQPGVEDPDKTFEDDKSLSELTKDSAEKALARHGGNRKLAAKDLGISDRTLYRWIKKWNLSYKQ